MSVTNRARALFLRALLHRRTRAMAGWLREIRRRALRQRHRLLVFLQLDDPYSYLLSYYLPDLARDYDIDLCLHLSESRSGDFQPAANLLAEYAIEDCRRLAVEFGIPFLDRGMSPPVEHRLAMLETIAVCDGRGNFDEELLQALSVYWRGDAEAASRRHTGSESAALADRVIARSMALQRRLGHYNSAMLYYAGEWYWGVDRLEILLQRLRRLGATRGGTMSAKFSSLHQAMQVALPVAPPRAAAGLPPLELFHSFRSPYSYLSLARTFEVADAFGLQLRIRPVLPMVMRGQPVPKQKLLYIVRDAACEADIKGIAFGKICDPLGAGAERCLAVFQFAESQGRGREFVLRAGEAIWAQALDVASDAGMRRVSDQAGLDWRGVEAAMKSTAWRAAIDENRESMMASGAWGVPTLRMGDFVAWGQDRDWVLVRHIEDLCASGDGILI